MTFGFRRCPHVDIRLIGYNIIRFLRAGRENQHQDDRKYGREPSTHLRSSLSVHAFQILTFILCNVPGFYVFFADMPGSLSVLTPLATPCESLEKAIFAAVRMTRLQLGDGERQTMTKGREGEMLLPPVSSL